MKCLVKFTKQEKKQGREEWLPGAERGEIREVVCRGLEVSVWDDEELLETESGDVCITVGMPLTLRNGMAKNG